MVTNRIVRGAQPITRQGPGPSFMHRPWDNKIGHHSQFIIQQNHNSYTNHQRNFSNNNFYFVSQENNKSVHQKTQSFPVQSVYTHNNINNGTAARFVAVASPTAAQYDQKIQQAHNTLKKTPNAAPNIQQQNFQKHIHIDKKCDHVKEEANELQKIRKTIKEESEIISQNIINNIKLDILEKKISHLNNEFAEIRKTTENIENKINQIKKAISSLHPQPPVYHNYITYCIHQAT